MSDQYEKIAKIEKEFWSATERLDTGMHDLYRFNDVEYLLDTLNVIETIITRFKKEVENEI